MKKATSSDITVVKLDHRGVEAWRYSGRLVSQDENSIIIEAFFNREDLQISGMWLRKGDRFIEIYYTDRWYNIFEIFDNGGMDLKGWYCNVAAPVIFEDDEITYRDLALDLLVFPDGKQVVLDEDEFSALNLTETERKYARMALLELRELFRRQPLFRITCP